MTRVLQWNVNVIEHQGDENKKMFRFENLHLGDKTIGAKLPMMSL